METKTNELSFETQLIKKFSENTMKITPELICYQFFISKGISKESQQMVCMLLCYELFSCENPKVDQIKLTRSYRLCMEFIPKELLTDKKIQEMIDFELD